MVDGVMFLMQVSSMTIKKLLQIVINRKQRKFFDGLDCTWVSSLSPEYQTVFRINLDFFIVLLILMIILGALGAGAHQVSDTCFAGMWTSFMLHQIWEYSFFVFHAIWIAIPIWRLMEMHVSF